MKYGCGDRVRLLPNKYWDVPIPVGGTGVIVGYGREPATSIVLFDKKFVRNSPCKAYVVPDWHLESIEEDET